MNPSAISHFRNMLSCRELHQKLCPCLEKTMYNDSTSNWHKSEGSSHFHNCLQSSECSLAAVLQLNYFCCTPVFLTSFLQLLISRVFLINPLTPISISESLLLLPKLQRQLSKNAMLETEIVNEEVTVDDKVQGKSHGSGWLRQTVDQQRRGGQRTERPE